MSQIGLSYHTRRRLPKIIQGLLKGKTHEQIAADCGVKRRTVDRDLRAWRESGGFEKWLHAEFMRLHGEVRDEKTERAYQTIARLLERTMRQRIEAEVKGQATIIVKFDSTLEADDGSRNQDTI